MPGAVTLVAPDNAAAGFALGEWAGRYAREHLDGAANLLDLTFDLPNTRQRSEGFLAGLRSVLPDARQVLSINAGSNEASSYQITRDVLAVHPEINMIFAINDATAAGAAARAATRRSLPTTCSSSRFGLEGNTLRNSLLVVRVLPRRPGDVPRDRRADLRRGCRPCARRTAPAAASRDADRRAHP